METKKLVAAVKNKDYAQGVAFFEKREKKGTGGKFAWADGRQIFYADVDDTVDAIILFTFAAGEWQSSSAFVHEGEMSEDEIVEKVGSW